MQISCLSLSVAPYLLAELGLEWKTRSDYWNHRSYALVSFIVKQAGVSLARGSSSGSEGPRSSAASPPSGAAGGAAARAALEVGKGHGSYPAPRSFASPAPGPGDRNGLLALWHPRASLCTFL